MYDIFMIVIFLIWLMGFIVLSEDPGGYIKYRQPSSIRILLWLYVLAWPITLFCLWVKHKLILRDF